MKPFRSHPLVRFSLWPMLASAALATVTQAADLVVDRPGVAPFRMASVEAGPTAARTGLLQFHSDCCAPCREMMPMVDALAAAGYRIERINVAEQPARAAEYGVERLPCFIAVCDGRETGRVVGRCSYQRLEALMRSATTTGQTKYTRATRAGAPIGRKPTSPTASQEPRPAWRYENPVGPKTAIVRIYCQEGAKNRSIGSGTLVAWNGRLVVLTARHVIQNAGRIIVELCTKRTHWAKVMKTDAVWDCAVLELVGRPEGVMPAEIERGDDAMQHEGDRLESCGYGPDGRLACNSGLFLGYRRSAQAPQGPDDWMVLSGHARGGDSGGPVFNAQNRLVGVLWGTDGREVVAVQAGRLHSLLDAAVPETSLPAPVRPKVEPQSLSGLANRVPTPAKPAERQPSQPSAALTDLLRQGAPDLPAASAMDRAQQECLRKLLGGCRQPPSVPQVIVQSDPELRQVLGNLDAKVGRLITATERAGAEPVVDEPTFSPLVAALCMLAAAAVGVVLYFGRGG